MELPFPPRAHHDASRSSLSPQGYQRRQGSGITTKDNRGNSGVNSPPFYRDIEHHAEKCLESIDLCHKRLDAESLRNFAQSSSRISFDSLNVLKLGFNDLKDEGVLVLTELLERNTTCLKTLDLTFNDIGDAGAKALAGCSTIKSSLEILYLSGNKITEVGFEHLSNTLLGATNLKAVHCSGNSGKSRGATYMADIIQKNGARVHTFCFNGNKIGAKGAEAIGQALNSNTSLVYLNLSDNELLDDGCSYIARGMLKHRTLKCLDLSFNGITSTGLSTLCNSLVNYHAMTKLNLDNNKIGDEGACHLSDALDHMSLSILNVGFNNICTKGIRRLLETVLVSPLLESLSISGNDINSEVADSLHNLLLYTRTLKSLYIDQNCVGEVGKKQIASGIASNAHANLKEFTGFQLGPLMVQLGSPKEWSTSSNEDTLKLLNKLWRNLKVKESDNSETSREPSLCSDGNPSSHINSRQSGTQNSMTSATTSHTNLESEATAASSSDLGHSHSRRAGRDRHSSSNEPLADDANSKMNELASRTAAQSQSFSTYAFPNISGVHTDSQEWVNSLERVVDAERQLNRGSMNSNVTAASYVKASDVGSPSENISISNKPDKRSLTRSHSSLQLLDMIDNVISDSDITNILGKVSKQQDKSLEIPPSMEKLANERETSMFGDMTLLEAEQTIDQMSTKEDSNKNKDSLSLLSTQAVPVASVNIFGFNSRNSGSDGGYDRNDSWREALDQTSKEPGDFKGISVELVKAVRAFYTKPFHPVALWELQQYYYSYHTDENMANITPGTGYSSVHNSIEEDSDDEASITAEEARPRRMQMKETDSRKSGRRDIEDTIQFSSAKRYKKAARISAYPRVQLLLESYTKNGDQAKMLSLLRQLRFLETCAATELEPGADIEQILFYAR